MCFVVFGVAAEFSQFLKIEEIDRHIDLSSAITRVSSKIVFKSQPGAGTISKVHFVLPKEDASHLAYISAERNSKQLTVSSDSKNDT